MTKRPDTHTTPALQTALPYIRAGLTAPQIAEVLGISASAANARVSRAIRMQLVDTATTRRQKAVGAMANIARTALVDGDAPPPFRLPLGLPVAVRNWLRTQARTQASVEDVVRGILVDAYFEAQGEEV